MLTTQRLLLRQWTPADRHPFAKMCADKEVMAFFPSTQSVAQSTAMAKRFQALIEEQSWGLWAVEIPGQHRFIGFVGLHRAKHTLPCAPCMEIGWRLAKAHWGQGYASEAARSVRDFAFAELGLQELVSFTTVANRPSIAVMERIGMRNSQRNFMHPDIPRSHPQCEHVLYFLHRAQWERNVR